jgi:hypothetical protein
MQCPFTYADGHRCGGSVTRVRAYGRHDRFDRVAVRDVRKFRLWCSEKDDHAGAVSDFVSKERMEFYPDQLVRLGLHDEALEACENLIREEA